MLHPFEYSPLSDQFKVLDLASVADKIAELDLDIQRRALLDDLNTRAGLPTHLQE